MEEQSAIAFDTDELERLKSSNLMQDFVRANDGSWDHVNWEGFIRNVRELGYCLPSDVIGAELEMEKMYYWKVKNGEIDEPKLSLKDIAVSQDATQCEAEAKVCESADSLGKVLPGDVSGPQGPEMPKKAEPFDPIMELENAIIVEEKSQGSKAAPAITEVETASLWDNVNFDSLSREEKAAYLKHQLRKKWARDKYDNNCGLRKRRGWKEQLCGEPWHCAIAIRSRCCDSGREPY
ncbi:MAG: hypothetical protein ABIF01_02320 [Candidatus Micrarchaeota archaeon]